MSKKCPHCQSSSQNFSKFGHFVRSSDRKILQRYRCKVCLKTFSQATFQSCYRQNKRQLNPVIQKLLISCVSQRRIAIILKISRTTVERKFRFLAEQSRVKNLLTLKKSSISDFQFDDLETFEHSKCKPLSVIMAVENSTRKILSFRVSSMPAKGHLARIARKKYGKRSDDRTQGRRALFEELQGSITPGATVWSDQSPHYPEDVKKYFPTSVHKTCKGRRGCVVGQGELKAGGFDPLFSLNHTFAMLRANINRLVRRTWCTTKRAENLARHIDLYVAWHNSHVI